MFHRSIAGGEGDGSDAENQVSQSNAIPFTMRFAIKHYSIGTVSLLCDARDVLSYMHRNGSKSKRSISAISLRC